MESAEIELKFTVADVETLEARLPLLGFVLETPRTFESNTLYDTPDRSLRERHHLLRIRRYGETSTLTHKRTTEDTSAGMSSHPDRYKVRIETETQVAEPVALASIFEQLGFVATFRYEKFRTEWTQPSCAACYGHPCHIVIDETPIGTFAELEGPPEWIDQALAQLDIDPADCLTDSYGALFLRWKQRTGSSAEHLTFDEIRAQADVPVLTSA